MLSHSGGTSISLNNRPYGSNNTSGICDFMEGIPSKICFSDRQQLSLSRAGRWLQLSNCKVVKLWTAEWQYEGFLSNQSTTAGGLTDWHTFNQKLWNQLWYCLVGRKTSLVSAITSKWFDTPTQSLARLLAVIIHKNLKLQSRLGTWGIYIRHGKTLELQIPAFSIHCTLWLLSFEVMQESERNKGMWMGSCDWSHLTATC